MQLYVPPPTSTPKICNVSKTASQSIPNGVLTDITWSAEVNDDHGMFDIASPTDFVIPADASFYQVMAKLRCQDPAGIGNWAFYIFEDGAYNFAPLGLHQGGENSNETVTHMVLSGWVPCSGGETIVFKAEQSSGGALNLSSGGAYHMWASIRAW